MDQHMPHYMYTKHTTCSRKPRRNSAVPSWTGGTKTIFTGVHCQKLDGMKKNIMEYDKIALEENSCTATSEERRRNENSWKLSSNAEGAHGPLDQRDDLKDAKEICKRLYCEHTAITG